MLRDSASIATEANPFTELIEPNLMPLKRFVIGALRNTADAEDVVQQTVLKAFSHLDQFRNDSQFNTWLRAIAVNEIRQFYRERQRHELRIPASETADIEVADGRESVLTAWLRQENAQAVRRAIGRLPGIYQSVIELRYLSGLSMDEIARRLSVGVGAVKTRLHRARQQLKMFVLESQAGPVGNAA
jgi:RNA polymerase sigma-70 factor (ECF subfamily)